MINKAKLWQTNDSHIWKFPTHDSNYFRIEKSEKSEKSENYTKKAILGTLNDDKVKEQKLSSSPQQLWRKGEGDNEGFFTLINSASNKILTAKSDNSLHVKHNIETRLIETKYLFSELLQYVNQTCQQIIFEQLGENVKQHPSLEKTIEIHVPIHDDESLIIHMDTSKAMPSFEFVE